MAEGLLRALGGEQFEAASAGTWEKAASCLCQQVNLLYSKGLCLLENCLYQFLAETSIAIGVRSEQCYCFILFQRRASNDDAVLMRNNCGREVIRESFYRESRAF
jgi:hypothetical protein